MDQTIQQYRDHVIEVRRRAGDDRTLMNAAGHLAAPDTSQSPFELLIDDKPVSYSRLFDGTLYLQENAYEWGDDLVNLAEKLIDFRQRADEARRLGEAEN